MFGTTQCDYFLVWHALIHLKEQDDEEYAMLSISVFVFQKIEDGITLSSSPLG